MDWIRDQTELLRSRRYVYYNDGGSRRFTHRRLFILVLDHPPISSRGSTDIPVYTEPFSAIAPKVSCLTNIEIVIHGR